MKEKVRTVLGLSAAHCINDIYSPVLPAILPLLIIQEGYSYFLAGMLVTVYNLSSSFTQPVIGWLYDKKGIRIPIPISVLFCAFFMSFIGLMHSYEMMLIFAIGGALGHAFFHPSALGLVSRIASGPDRGRLTSLFVVGGNLGFAIGPVLAGILVAFGGTDALVFLIIPGLAIAVVLKKLLPPVSELEKNYAKDGENSGNKKFPVAPIAILVAASAFRSWVIFSSVAFIPTFLTTRGFDLITANLLTSLMLIAGVAGQIIGATMSDKYGRKEYIIFGMITSIPPFFLFLATDGILSIIAMFAFGYLLWSTFSVTVAMSHELAPGGTGTVSGLMLGFAVGAGGAGVAITGYVADLTSAQMAFTLLIIPIIVALVLFFVLPYPWKLLNRSRRPAEKFN